MKKERKTGDVLRRMCAWKDRPACKHDGRSELEEIKAFPTTSAGQEELPKNGYIDD